ncbi:HNH endonuclease [Candidatus Saccharibacteria bacterium]|nr:HNH endonuclease [Candidatus Saccharibacteria bacterium]
MKEKNKYRNRKIIAGAVGVVAILLAIFLNPESYKTIYIDFGGSSEVKASENNSDAPLASEILEKLEVKGRAPKTGYARTEFYDSWPSENGCNLRQRILKRDFGETAVLASDNCTVISGSLYEPYTGQEMTFTEKTQISKGLQIDHIVALSDAWQKGAQYKTAEERFALATDTLNLIAVDSSANQQKSDGDAATWLPKNKSFRCQYVARQVSVKYKYGLWVTSAEKDAISRVLSDCPNEKATI